MLSIRDVERLQKLYSECRIELRNGNIIIANPSDAVTGEIGARFGMLLGSWVDDNELGYVFGASAGLSMPNGDLLLARLSFVSRDRLKRLTSTYLQVVPDLVVEIKSIWDRIAELKDEIALFLSQGVQVAILVDPDKYTVTIYRRSELSKDTEDDEPILEGTNLGGVDILTIPELFPGLEIPISRIWPRVYEE